MMAMFCIDSSLRGYETRCSCAETHKERALSGRGTQGFSGAYLGVYSLFLFYLLLQGQQLAASVVTSGYP